MHNHVTTSLATKACTHFTISTNLHTAVSLGRAAKMTCEPQGKSGNETPHECYSLTIHYAFMIMTFNVELPLADCSYQP